MNKILIGGGASLASVLNFISILLWAKILAPEEYGTYALIATWGLLLNGTVFEWLRQTLSRNIYDSERQYRPESVSPIVALYALTIFLLSVFYVVVLLVISPHSNTLFWILIFAVAEGSFVITVTLHTIYARARRYFVSMVGRGTAIPVLSYFLIQQMDDQGVAVVTAIVSVSLIIAFVNFLFEPALRCVQLSQITRANIKATVGFGLPLAFSATTNALAGQIDRILVGAILGPTTLGVYAVICDIAQKPISVLLTAINTVAYPYYLRSTENSGIAQGFKSLNLSGNYLIAATVGMPVVCYLFGDLLLGFFYNEDIPSYAAVVFGAAAATALVRGLLGAFYFPAFQLARETRIIMQISVTLMIASLSATSLGGLAAGIYGIALGSLIAVIIGLSVAENKVRRLGPASLFTRRNFGLALAHVVWLPLYLLLHNWGYQWWILPALYITATYSTASLVMWRQTRIGKTE